MKKNIFFAIFACFFAFLSACNNRINDIKPAIVPEVEKKAEEPKIKSKGELDIIGAVEPIYILPIKAPFYARIDTGAETSSIDVKNLTKFERDGEKWVSFDIEHRESHETHHFEKKIKKRVAIRRAEEYEHRRTVDMTVKFGGKTFTAGFSLADRSDFEYQALVGRNILTGRAIVDTSVSNTLR